MCDPTLIEPTDPESALRSIWEHVAPLGQARAITTKPALNAYLVEATSFLPDTAVTTERLYVFVSGRQEPVGCEVCSGGVRWNPRKRHYHRTCSPTCAAVLTPMRDRKTQQKRMFSTIEATLIASVDPTKFDPVYADAFVRAHCTRSDGRLDGNLTNTVVFERTFGRDALDRVLSDYIVNHAHRPFAEYAASLRGLPACEVCGSPAAFDSHAEGFRRTCSALCGNRLADKVEAIRTKALSPSQERIAAHLGTVLDRERTARDRHHDLIAAEALYTIIDDLPRGDVRQFDHLRYRFRCSTCRGEFESAFDNRRCYTCAPLRYTLEDELARAFIDHAPETRKRSLLPYKRLEIDVYFARHRLGVELDGTYFHSFGAEQADEERAKRYAQEAKQDACEAAGIRLIAFFENEWRDKQDIALSMVAARLGESTRVYARSCTVRPTPPAEARTFLTTNHMQGWCQSSEAWGLYQGDRLLALMTFGSPRFKTAGDYELLRFCNALGTTVVGGASRLLRAFEAGKSGRTLISYANRRFSDGALYDRLGFTRSHTSRPNYYWTRAGVVRHRVAFQKHKLAKLLPDFDPALTEAQNMFAAGYRRLWDHGHLVFKKHIGV